MEIIVQDREYAVILENTDGSWGAYSPDVDGCIACGDTMEETLELFRQSLAHHLEALREEGLPIPEPSTKVSTVRIAA